MNDLFTRGIGPDGKLRPPRSQAPELYKKTELGWIPKEWRVEILEEILEEAGGYLQTGPFGSQLHSYEYTEEGTAVIMPQNINDGSIDFQKASKISKNKANSLIRHKLQKGDVVIARRGDLSRAAEYLNVEYESICGTGCFLLRLLKSELKATYFSNLFRHDILQRQIAGLSVGSTMESLNNNIMGKLLLPFPNTQEQIFISDTLYIMESKLNLLIDQISKLQKQKAGLMQDLLTGKVEVPVPEDEAVHG